jgi:hypothetical protein
MLIGMCTRTVGSHVTHRGVVDLVGRDWGILLICGAATLGSSAGEGATIEGAIFRDHNGGDMSSWDTTLCCVLYGAGTLGVASGATATVMIVGCGCEGYCGGVHSMWCVSMSAI